MTLRSSAFGRAALGEFLDLVSACAGARFPRATYLMRSDVCWRLPGSAPAQNVRLWCDDRGLAGYVSFEPPTGMEFDLRPDLSLESAIAEEMLAWAESRRRAFAPAYPRFVDLDSMVEWEREIRDPEPPRAGAGHCLTASAMADDEPRTAFLERHDFERTRHFAPHYRRSLALPIPEPELALGLTLRHVREPDFPERVATHRDAWLGSTADVSRYLDVRALPDYDPELDIVLQTPDGTFASYCICWRDDALRVGSYEPVGTRPAWRGRGIGRQVLYEGFRRLKARGMRWAQVETAGFNTPAQALYESCDFEPVGRALTFMKTV